MIIAIVLASCVLAIIVVVIIIAIIVVYKKKSQNSDLTEPFVNNRIVVQKNGEGSARSYGTF